MNALRTTLKARREASRNARSFDRAYARAYTPSAQHELMVIAATRSNK